MNNPNYGFIKTAWCHLGKPFRNNLIRLENAYKYNIKKNVNPFADMKRLIKKQNPVIVDGGAGNGDTVVTLKQHFPNSTILAFEPLRFIELEKFTKEFKDVHISYLALGEENRETILFETKFPETSSLYPHSDIDRKPQHGLKEKRKVNMISLDSWSEENHFPEIDILKLDLQGYELNALKGSKKLLQSSIKIVYVECSFRKLYVGQPLFDDVYKFLFSLGFEVWNIYKHSNSKPIRYIDVMFVRDDNMICKSCMYKLSEKESKISMGLCPKCGRDSLVVC